MNMLCKFHSPNGTFNVLGPQTQDSYKTIHFEN